MPTKRWFPSAILFLLVLYEWAVLLVPPHFVSNSCVADVNCSPQMSERCDAFAALMDAVSLVNPVLVPLLGVLSVYVLLVRVKTPKLSVLHRFAGSRIVTITAIVISASVLLASSVVTLSVAGLIFDMWPRYAKFGTTTLSVGLGAFWLFLLLESLFTVLSYGALSASNALGKQIPAAISRYALAVTFVGVGLYVPFFLSPLADWRAS